MNNDLISREALKEALYDFLSENSTTCDWEDIFNVIDNAQAVDLWQMRQEATENALKKAEVLYARPKGEWIKVKEERMSVDMSGDIVTRYKCSKCGRVIATLPSKLAEYYPFCHCGAKMKGGAE